MVFPGPLKPALQKRGGQGGSKMRYKKVVKRIKEILAEKPDVGAYTLSFILQNEGLIKSNLSFTAQETQELMNRQLASWKRIYENEHVRVMQELPLRRVWFHFNYKNEWKSLGYMI